jgi:hypothetical protein
VKSAAKLHLPGPNITDLSGIIRSESPVNT